MKKLIALMMCTLMMLTFAACAPADEPAEGDIVAQIKADGKLVIATEAQYAPFEFKDADANIVGADIWLAEKIAEKLGVELEIVDMAFDGIIPAIQNMQAHVGIAAFTNTAERAEIIDFSDVYQKNEQTIVVHVDEVDNYHEYSDFDGLKLGSQKGTFQSTLITDLFPNAELFELAKYPEIALEVANKNIAGFVVDLEVGQSFVDANDQLAISNISFGDETMDFGKACVLNQEHDALKEVINEVIAEVLADGSFEVAYQEAVELAKTLGV